MDRAQKAESVEGLKAAFAGTSLVAVAHYTGLTVAELTDLRRRMRLSEASIQVTKNRLARIAIRDTDYAGLDDLFRGPTAIALSKNPVAAAKVATAYAKENEKFVILGGSLGTQRLDVAAVQALATLPSLDELRGKIVGLLLAPPTKLASLIQAPGGQLARVIQAYADKANTQQAA